MKPMNMKQVATVALMQSIIDSPLPTADRNPSPLATIGVNLRLFGKVRSPRGIFDAEFLPKREATKLPKVKGDERSSSTWITRFDAPVVRPSFYERNNPRRNKWRE